MTAETALTSTTPAIDIYIKLAQYPVLADRIRMRMREELFQRGVITQETFEDEVKVNAIESQKREGLQDPFGQEEANIWQKRKDRIREYLTDAYFAFNLGSTLLEQIISEVRTLQNMSADNLASMETTVGTVVSILEYIERLDSSLEEINAGSAAISEIIRSVDDAAGQSAVSALHMNSTMGEIRQRNKDIVGFSESTQKGVTRLQKSMCDAAQNLGEFKVEGGQGDAASGQRESAEVRGIRETTEVSEGQAVTDLEPAALTRVSG